MKLIGNLLNGGENYHVNESDAINISTALETIAEAIILHGIISNMDKWSDYDEAIETIKEKLKNESEAETA